MLELIAVVVFIAVLFAIEIYYVKTKQLTISEHVQQLLKAMGPQLSHGIMFLLGCLAGWFVAHFSTF